MTITTHSNKKFAKTGHNDQQNIDFGYQYTMSVAIDGKEYAIIHTWAKTKEELSKYRIEKLSSGVVKIFSDEHNASMVLAEMPYQMEDKTRAEWLAQYGANEWVHPKTGEIRHYLNIEKIFANRVLLNREKGMKIYVVNDNIVFGNVNDIKSGLEEFLAEAYAQGIICEEVRNYHIGYKIYGE